MAPQIPIVNAMLLCEHIHRDSSSGKLTLLGVFDEIRVSPPAVDLDAFSVYLNLTNMRGRYHLDLRWLHGDTEEELGRVGSVEPFEVSDPLSRVEIVVRGGGLPLPDPGRYVLRLQINGRHLHDYVIMVTELLE